MPRTRKNGEEELIHPCLVTTFAGSFDTVRDGVGTAAGIVNPFTVCYSAAGNSLLCIQVGGCVRRIHLTARSEIRNAVGQSVATGLEMIAPALSAISPLIELIAAYAAEPGTGV